MCRIAYKGEEGSRFRTDAKNNFFRAQNLKTFIFCTKEAITLLFIIAYRKV